MKHNVPVLLYNQDGYYQMLTLGRVFKTLQRHFYEPIPKSNPVMKNYRYLYAQAKEIEKNRDNHYLDCSSRIIVAKHYEGSEIYDNDILELSLKHIKNKFGEKERLHFQDLLSVLDYGETLSRPDTKSEKLLGCINALMRKYDLNSETIKKYDIKDGKEGYYGFPNEDIKKALINGGIFVQYYDYCVEHQFHIDRENIPVIKPIQENKPLQPKVEPSKPVEPVKTVENQEISQSAKIVENIKLAKKRDKKESKYHQLSLFDR